MTELEEAALRSWKWSKNEAVLHWDDRVRCSQSAIADHSSCQFGVRLTPVSHSTQLITSPLTAAWNYLTSTSKPDEDAKSTSSEIDTVSLFVHTSWRVVSS